MKRFMLLAMTTIFIAACTTGIHKAVSYQDYREGHGVGSCRDSNGKIYQLHY